MAARDIAYVELYTSNAREVVDYLVNSMGFTQMAEYVDSRSRSAWLRQGSAHLIVTEGACATTFVDQHGDGIADIAFMCDDVGQTLENALTAGTSIVAAEAGCPAVSGFGDVRHTLVARAAQQRVPGRRSWVPTVAGPARADGRIQLLDHVAVCVAGGTLAEWVRFYTDGFGLDRYSSEFIEVGSQAMDSVVVRSPSGGITFTILEPVLTRNPGQVDDFLLKNAGAGVQHLAFRVDNIVSTVHEFRGAGVDFLHIPAVYYDLLADRLPGLRAEIADLRAADLLADRDSWGYLLQLFTRSPYERNTLFYELVERRGARGFGSANIKALYEAVERDRTATL
jgi:4-hydroxymandelate synthase